MASRSLGEVLLRPSPWARIPSTPSSSPRIWTWIPPCTARRGIASTPPPSAPAQAQRVQDKEEDVFPLGHNTPQPLRQQPEQPSKSETSEEINMLIARVTGTRPLTSRHSMSRVPTSSGDDVGAARRAHLFGNEFSSAPLGTRRPPGLNFDAMSLPDTILDPTFSNKPTEADVLASRIEETLSNYPRLTPTYGRTVELDASRGRDIVRGVSMLSSLVARNKIKNDKMRQRYHERDGLKRKRLHSERWRAKFKVGFQALTSRVSELTRKGW